MSRQRDERANAVGEFYAAHAADLIRRVSSRVRYRPHATIEDACQFAWLSLMRRPDVRLDDRGLAWLATVATREAWRLGTPHEASVCDFVCMGRAGEPGTCVEPASDAPDPAERAIDAETHQHRVARLRTLKHVERQTLVLKAAGCSYAEIGQLTGTTYRAVNRRLVEGRKRLRRDR